MTHARELEPGAVDPGDARHIDLGDPRGEPQRRRIDHAEQRSAIFDERPGHGMNLQHRPGKGGADLDALGTLAAGALNPSILSRASLRCLELDARGGFEVSGLEYASLGNRPTGQQAFEALALLYGLLDIKAGARTGQLERRDIGRTFEPRHEAGEHAAAVDRTPDDR